MKSTVLKVGYKKYYVERVLMMGNVYTPSEYIKNVYSLIMTKLTMRQARFIRRPIYVRGRKSLSGCNGLTTGRFCRFDLDGTKKTLYIGDKCEMGDMTHIVAHENVRIGNNVLIASKCFISDTNHGVYKGENQDNPSIAPKERKLVSLPVIIGDNVWIGENVVILAGSKIGNGCVIGANSVVNKSIPNNSVVVGSNRIIKQFDFKTNTWVGNIKGMDD